MTRVTAFAPATVANVIVGFDSLGFAFDALGDRVTVELVRDGRGRVELATTSGVTEVPMDPHQNTATVALRSLVVDAGVRDSLLVSVDKGIPLGSGMGGSAASAVGAVVAGVEVCGLSANPKSMLRWALAGEAAASGAEHADNVAPCLRGGMVLAAAGEVHGIPVPSGIDCVVVRPELRVDTRDARSALPDLVTLSASTERAARLGVFVNACRDNDLSTLRRVMHDELIEPLRARAIPGFGQVRAAAIEVGAVCCGVAGSGPSVFAWAPTEVSAAVEAAMLAAFDGNHMPASSWRMSLPGAAAACENE